MFLILGVLGLAGVGFVIYSQGNSTTNSDKLKSNLQKTQKKQKEELTKLKEALNTEDYKDSNTQKKRSARRR